eukprot:11168-Amphidinium_carterae.1
MAGDESPTTSVRHRHNDGSTMTGAQLASQTMEAVPLPPQPPQSPPQPQSPPPGDNIDNVTMATSQPGSATYLDSSTIPAPSSGHTTGCATNDLEDTAFSTMLPNGENSPTGCQVHFTGHHTRRSQR